MRRFLSNTMAVSLIALQSVTAFAQNQLNPTFELEPANGRDGQPLGVSDGALSSGNKLQIEVDLSGNGKRELKNAIPIFTDLRKYTQGEIAALERSLIGETFNGIRVKSAKALRESNLIVMSTAHELQVLWFKGEQMVVVGLDQFGRPIPMTGGDIFIGRSNGTVNCAAAQGLQLAQHSPVQARFQILADISGSMEDSLPEVIRATRNFLDGVPRNAYCRVATYNQQYSVVDAHNGHDGWKLCNSRNWNLGSIQASGGTNSTTALQASFADLKAAHPYFVPANATMISGLVVITDGDGVDQAQIASLKSMKGNIPVFAYFEGHQTTTSYEQWVETYQSASDGVDVIDAFKTFSTTYLNARVVTRAGCS